MSDAIHSLGVCLGWVLRNKGTFLMSLGGVATAIATGILAIFTIKMARANARLIEISNAQFELNRRQFNRQFLGKPYEQIALLLTDTLETLNHWLADLDGAALSSMPGSSGMVEKVAGQKEMSKEVTIKLKLYPNSQVDPLVEAWMLMLIQVMTFFNDLYEQSTSDAYGKRHISDSIRQEAVIQISEQIRALEMQLNSILEAMSQELVV
jgi:hypothetical protein